MPFLLDTPRNHLEAPALISARGAISYRILIRKAEKVARQLMTLGVEPGDSVAVKGPPTVEVVTALHGVWMAGAAAAPMNPGWTREEEARGLKLLEPRVVLVAEGEAIPEAAPEKRRLLTLGNHDERGLQSLLAFWADTSPLDSRPASVRKGEAAVRLLTSGTSGSPSVVTLTFGNLTASARGARERLSLHSSDRWLASLSPAHVGGVAMVARAALVGSALVLAGRFRAEVSRRMVADGAITHASLVPTMLRRFIKTRGAEPASKTLRCLLIGGAHADEDLVREALDLGLPLALTYGMTEASSQVATAPPELVARKPGTVGRPLPGVEIRMSPENEILVRGETVAPGKGDEEGWLHTGDLGRLDGDGDLWITGRISSRIISGGVNVDPAEVEALLRTHPGVREVAVVGIPDPEWGERVAAAVVADSGRIMDRGELDRLSRAALSPAKRPGTYALVRALPRNPNGKVDRERVRDLFR